MLLARYIEKLFGGEVISSQLCWREVSFPMMMTKTARLLLLPSGTISSELSRVEAQYSVRSTDLHGTTNHNFVASLSDIEVSEGRNWTNQKKNLMKRPGGWPTCVLRAVWVGKVLWQTSLWQQTSKRHFASHMESATNHRRHRQRGAVVWGVIFPSAGNFESNLLIEFQLFWLLLLIALGWWVWAHNWFSVVIIMNGFWA